MMSTEQRLRPSVTLSPAGLAGVLALGLGYVAGLATIRVLYEALFPAALWLARPGPALLLALLPAGAVYAAWRWLARRGGQPLAALAALLPLLLNLVYLFSPAVDPRFGPFLLLASGWLASLLAAALLRVKPVRLLLWLWAALLPTYLLTMGRAVGRADTFEFQVVIPQLGIAHPTGYPLYLLLGRLFSLLPAGSVAWRINLASVAFALVAVSLVYLLGLRLSQPGRAALAALLAALLLGLLPTFWSQAIEAEVYALHALFVAAVLLLLITLLRQPQPSAAPKPYHRLLALAFALGLGLTNHLTTLFLLPPAGITLLFVYRPAGLNLKRLAGLALAFLAPLLLYAYLPLRWAAVNGEPMGAARFVDWVIGGRFQGALQLTAWLHDATRYQVVGRLFLAEWQPPILLLLVPVGLVVLFARQWRVALVLLLTWLGYTFYALNYYVPDLAVFLLPAHLVMAVWWGVGLAALVQGVAQAGGRFAPLGQAALYLLAIGPLVVTVGQTRWAAVSRASSDGQTGWAAGVLAQPLAQDGAILADSDKFPPLYYLQQAEGARPDLDITVLPDEAAYRANLAARLAAGQTVYLARYLPGLAGSYHLRSAGPLVEVGTAPLATLPAGAQPSDLRFGQVRLRGYLLEAAAATDPAGTALTLFWQADEPLDEVWHVYTRWAGQEYVGAPIPPAGQHPANNSYPTVAWEPGELVPDYHWLPRPGLNAPQELALQVALAPPFTRPEALAWQTVTTLLVAPPAALAEAQPQQPLRAQVGPLLLSGAVFPAQVRPGSALNVALAGYGAEAAALQVALRPAGEATRLPGEQQALALPAVATDQPFVYTLPVGTAVPAGRYQLFAYHPALAARCGWLAPLREGCVLGEVTVSGVPLPAGATNFADQIALLDIDVPETELRPGGTLALTLHWQSLAPLPADYTVFVQVLDAQDRIVGQVDSWPLQGTYPTSQWPAGEVVSDPYLVPLAADLPPGPYRLQVGWYLLATLQRLPVLDEVGNIVDDKVMVEGLVVR